jgi:MFS family permease
MANAELSSRACRVGARPSRAPIVLGRRASLWVSAGVVAHTLWTSAAPAMVYRLFAQEWHLSHAVTTGIFAVYPIVVVAVLVGFGGISDHIGRRATMLMGLGASLAGTLLFALAPSVSRPGHPPPPSWSSAPARRSARLSSRPWRKLRALPPLWCSAAR